MVVATRIAHFLSTAVGLLGLLAFAGVAGAASATGAAQSNSVASAPPAISVSPVTHTRPAARPARAAPTAAWDASQLAHLARPDALILIRHANAPGVGDPSGFDLNSCATQRNLDDVGRNQAEALGNAWKTAGIFPSRIFTSAWCRCVDTAISLQMGPVAILAELNSFWEQEDRRSIQTARLKDFIHRLDPTGGPYVMVTHQVNISELTGSFVSSGAGVVVQLGRESGLTFERLPEK